MPEPKTTKEDLANILVNLAIELVVAKVATEAGEQPPTEQHEWEEAIGDEISNASFWFDGGDSIGGPDLWEDILDPVIAEAARREANRQD